MTTLFLLSRGYYQMRAALDAALRSPFLQAALVLLVVFAVGGRIGPLGASAVEASVSAVYTSAPKAAAKAKGSDDRLLAWSILASRGTKGAAERAALEHLFSVGEPLDGLSFAGSGLDLSGIRLGAVGDRVAQLRGVGFANVKLVGAQFDGAELTGADFTGASLAGANFTSARMDSVKLGGADLSTASLRRAVLDRARMGGALMPAADLRDASLKRASAVGARMQGLLAMNADLRGADLTRALLVGANFTGARIDGALFEGAEVSGASFLGAAGVDAASFDRAWAWADTPPTGLPTHIRIALCDPGVGDEKRRAHMALKSRSAKRPIDC